MSDEKSHVGMARCFFCGEPSVILLDKRLKNTFGREPLPPVDCEPCNQCKEWMEKGIILIGFDGEEQERSGETDPRKYSRTGEFAVVRDQAIERWIEDGPFANVEPLEKCLETRVLFLPGTVMRKLGIIED